MNRKRVALLVLIASTMLIACACDFFKVRSPVVTAQPRPGVVSPPPITRVSPSPRATALMTETPSEAPTLSTERVKINALPVVSASLLAKSLPELKKWSPVDVPQQPAEQRLPGQKVAYLTFDDGPAPVGARPLSGTSNLLKILEKHNIRATFFMVGSHVYQNPELARRVVADGNVVGNHTWSHVNLQKVQGETFTREITYTNKVIYDTTGMEPTLLRPPGGFKPDQDQLSYMEQQHLRVFYWNVDTKDWAGHSDAEIIASVQQKLGLNVLVILCHDYAFSALDQVIDLLQKNGYAFDTLDHLADTNLPSQEN